MPVLMHEGWISILFLGKVLNVLKQPRVSGSLLVGGLPFPIEHIANMSFAQQVLHVDVLGPVGRRTIGTKKAFELISPIRSFHDSDPKFSRRVKLCLTVVTVGGVRAPRLMM